MFLPKPESYARDGTFQQSVRNIMCDMKAAQPDDLAKYIAAYVMGWNKDTSGLPLFWNPITKADDFLMMMEVVWRWGAKLVLEQDCAMMVYTCDGHDRKAIVRTKGEIPLLRAACICALICLYDYQYGKHQRR